MIRLSHVRRREMIGRQNAAKTLLGCVGPFAVGCGAEYSETVAVKTPNPANTAAPGEKKTVNILCSFFPVYLFTKNVVGDAEGATVSLMLPASKGCPHGYDLTPGDGKRIAGADVIILN